MLLYHKALVWATKAHVAEATGAPDTAAQPWRVPMPELLVQEHLRSQLLCVWVIRAVKRIVLDSNSQLLARAIISDPTVGKNYKGY